MCRWLGGLVQQVALCIFVGRVKEKQEVIQHKVSILLLASVSGEMRAGLLLATLCKACQRTGRRPLANVMYTVVKSKSRLFLDSLIIFFMIYLWFLYDCHLWFFYDMIYLWFFMIILWFIYDVFMISRKFHEIPKENSKNRFKSSKKSRISKKTREKSMKNQRFPEISSENQRKIKEIPKILNKS